MLLKHTSFMRYCKPNLSAGSNSLIQAIRLQIFFCAPLKPPGRPLLPSHRPTLRAVFAHVSVYAMTAAAVGANSAANAFLAPPGKRWLFCWPLPLPPCLGICF